MLKNSFFGKNIMMLYLYFIVIISMQEPVWPPAGG